MHFVNLILAQKEMPELQPCKVTCNTVRREVTMGVTVVHLTHSYVVTGVICGDSATATVVTSSLYLHTRVSQK